jgi:hypothetical protein
LGGSGSRQRLGTGPVTGPLERPSQGAPENRKATNRKTAIATNRTPSTALRGLHAAERQLLDAAHRAAVADKRAVVSAHFSSLLSSAEQRIIAHVLGRIAAIDPTLSIADRQAAIQRLQAEQEAALARLRQDIGQERRNTLRAALAALSVGHRSRKAALSRRQAAERVGLRRASSPSVFIHGQRHLRRPSVRRIAAKLSIRSRPSPGTLRPRH